ncbi:hypothetical protein DFH06DRAFT_555452 [Mycena polygramma]|nr:hypothetical protein DFH06DRAFT_555452 [Mycena polygramma]
MTQYNDADKESINSTSDSDASETPTMTEEEWQQKLADLKKEFKKYDRAKKRGDEAKVKRLEGGIWAATRALAEGAKDPKIRAEWEKKADNFKTAADGEKENVLMDIAKGLGLIVASPFILAGGVLYGVGLVTKGLGDLLTGGKASAAMR